MGGTGIRIGFRVGARSSFCGGREGTRKGNGIGRWPLSEAHRERVGGAPCRGLRRTTIRLRGRGRGELREEEEAAVAASRRAPRMRRRRGGARCAKLGRTCVRCLHSCSIFPA